MKNNIVWLILDSCRYDSFVRAHTPNIDKLGKAEKRFSYASWTAPSHYAFLMGILPHKSPQHVFASEVYKEEYSYWATRTGFKDIVFRDFLPELSLPKMLNKLGYHTVAKVSMPVLNQFTLLNNFFDEYKLMDNHNDFAGMIDEIQFKSDVLSFYFLNLGETHYPYMLKDKELPLISGVHGVLRDLDVSRSPGSAPGKEGFFDDKQMQRLHTQQIRCVEHVDTLLASLMDKAPENTYFVITADHGEVFGEDGYFGHGPIMHEKCFEVPFVEGTLL